LDFTRLVPRPIEGIAGQAQLQVGALVNLSSPSVTLSFQRSTLSRFISLLVSRKYLEWRRPIPDGKRRGKRAAKNLRLELILGRRLNLST